MDRTWICRTNALAAREVRFIWCVLPGDSTIQFNRHFQEHFNGQTPDSFYENIIFMSMFNDIEWTKNDNADICLRSAKEVVTFAAHFKPRRWCFLEFASIRGGTTFQFFKEHEILSHCKWLTYSSLILLTRYFQRKRNQLRNSGSKRFPRYIRQQEDSHQDHVGKQFIVYCQSTLSIA